MTVDWAERNAMIVAAEGDERARLHEEFATDWHPAYAEAFIQFAVSRGWSRENAESWPDDIWEDALVDVAAKYDWCPIRTAQADVIECEKEHEDGQLDGDRPT
jgi:hypothetical protein